MQTQIERLRQEMRYENRRFTLQALTTAAAVFAAGGVIGGLIVRLMIGG